MSSNKERLEILVDANAKLRAQLLAMTEALADERKKVEVLEEQVVALVADNALLANKLKAKQMHLDAMNDPKVAIYWHERYLREILK